MNVQSQSWKDTICTSNVEREVQVLTSLPDELISHISSYLPFQDLSSLAIATEKFYCITGGAQVWQHLCSRASIKLNENQFARAEFLKSSRLVGLLALGQFFSDRVFAEPKIDLACAYFDRVIELVTKQKKRGLVESLDFNRISGQVMLQKARGLIESGARNYANYSVRILYYDVCCLKILSEVQEDPIYSKANKAEADFLKAYMWWQGIHNGLDALQVDNLLDGVIKNPDASLTVKAEASCARFTLWACRKSQLDDDQAKQLLAPFRNENFTGAVEAMVNFTRAYVQYNCGYTEYTPKEVDKMFARASKDKYLTPKDHCQAIMYRATMRYRGDTDDSSMTVKELDHFLQIVEANTKLLSEANIHCASWKRAMLYLRGETQTLTDKKAGDRLTTCLNAGFQTDKHYACFHLAKMYFEGRYSGIAYSEAIEYLQDVMQKPQLKQADIEEARAILERETSGNQQNLCLLQ